MAEYKRPKNKADFYLNFKQKKPLMNKTEAYYESSRCLFCYDAPCIKACPTHIDIPLFIKQINTKNTEGAAETIFNSNWLGNACGIVCPTDVLCEGACVYNHQDVLPIQIGRLQNFATNNVIKKNKKLYKSGANKNKKIAIIGAGPAGIACACELRTLGYEVVIYEAKKQPSGLAVHGIAPYKITNQEVIEEINYLQKQLDFTILYNAAIKTKKQITALENNYDAIFLGVGLGYTKSLQLKGEINKNVIGAVEFIEELRKKQHQINVPNKVVVIGGGNTAIDAATESAKMGAEKVTLVYRRSKEEMGAYDFEYNFALNTGVKGLFNVAPLEILGKDILKGLKLIKTTSRNGKLHTIEGSEFIIDCDLIIKATGQAKQGSFYELIDDLKIDHKTKIEVNEFTYQTSNPTYFAGGDAVNGGAEVVNAAYEGKMAAKGIHGWLTTNS